MLGTLAMSQSCGKGSKACIHRLWKEPQEFTQCQPLRVSSQGIKHIESTIGSSMIQWEKMQRKIWDGEIHLCHTPEFMLVEEVWDSEWERVP